MVLAKYNGELVAVLGNNYFATTFHPELIDNPKVQV
ncbi:hypothetical protein GF366_00480 [Candidatus Peregrinibacteria bacterium]|nr:hypothetical protein [Candidatus Peregrinibacteria bacterium]